MKRIINLNHFGLWGDLRQAAITAASRRLIVREAGDGHAIEFAGARRDGDGTYAGVEFDGPQSPEIETVLAEHLNHVTEITSSCRVAHSLRFSKIFPNSVLTSANTVDIFTCVVKANAFAKEYGNG